jgi:hypothetical protein
MISNEDERKNKGEHNLCSDKKKERNPLFFNATHYFGLI